MRDAEDFNDLVADIEHRGYGVGHGRLSRWERVVDRLKDDDLNNAEVMLEDGLTERRFRVQYPERMKVGWNFEEAWGKGVGIEEDVAPDEMPGGNQTGQVVPGEVVPDEVVTGDGAPEHEELKTVDPTDGDSGIDMDGDVEKASPSVKRLGDDVEKITSKVKRLRDALERLHL